jgi:hypothetical protein
MNFRLAVFLSGFVAIVGVVQGQANFPMTSSGLKYLVTDPGGGTQVRSGKVVVFHYVATLRDGTVIVDTRKSNQPAVFTVGRDHVIQGWNEGFLLLHGGDRASFVVPPHLGYTENRPAGVSPDAQVRFDVEVLEVRERRLVDDLRSALTAGGTREAERLLAREKAAGFAGTYASMAELQVLSAALQEQGKSADAKFILEVAARFLPVPPSPK